MEVEINMQTYKFNDTFKQWLDGGFNVQELIESIQFSKLSTTISFRNVICIRQSTDDNNLILTFGSGKFINIDKSLICNGNRFWCKNITKEQDNEI